MIQFNHFLLFIYLLKALSLFLKQFFFNFLEQNLMGILRNVTRQITLINCVSI